MAKGIFQPALLGDPHITGDHSSAQDRFFFASCMNIKWTPATPRRAHTSRAVHSSVCCTKLIAMRRACRIPKLVVCLALPAHDQPQQHALPGVTDAVAAICIPVHVSCIDSLCRVYFAVKSHKEGYMYYTPFILDESVYRK